MTVVGGIKTVVGGIMTVVGGIMTVVDVGIITVVGATWQFLFSSNI